MLHTVFGLNTHGVGQALGSAGLPQMLPAGQLQQPSVRAGVAEGGGVPVTVGGGNVGAVGVNGPGVGTGVEPGATHCPRFG